MSEQQQEDWCGRSRRLSVRIGREEVTEVVGSMVGGHTIRVWKAIARMSAFTLSEMGSHWGVLSKGIMCSVLCFKRIILATLSKIYCAGQEAGQGDELGDYCTQPGKR